MERIPNIKVAASGDRYKDAAILCNQYADGNNKGEYGWAAAINAALALEIYLKSFLSKEVLTSVGSGVNMVTAKTERGHNLVELYNKIPANIQDLIISCSLAINPNIELLKSLEKFKDYFFNARYCYELESIKSVDSSVVDLASHMYLVLLKVAETTHN